MTRRVIWALVGSYGLFVAFALVVLQVFEVPARGPGPFLRHPPPPVELLVIGLFATLFAVPWAVVLQLRAPAPEPRGDTLVWQPALARRTPRWLLVGAFVIGFPTVLLTLQDRSTRVPGLETVAAGEHDVVSCRQLRDRTDDLARARALCHGARKARILVVLVMAGSFVSGLLGVIADRAGPRVREVVLDGQGLQLSGDGWRRRIAWSTVRGLQVELGLYWPVPLARRQLVMALVDGERVSIPCAGSPRGHVDAFLAAARRAHLLHETDRPAVPDALRALRT
ncbi:MAG: hypothetical protein AAF602_03245 [Myxococcota bacterium]